MERLTTRNSMGVAVYKQPYECDKCNETIWRLPDYGNGSPTDRLAKYEELEEQCIKETTWGFKELLHKWKVFLEDMVDLVKYRQLEEQGLLLRLPVAIGQTVYTNLSMQGWYCRNSNRPYEAEVVYIGLNNCEESGGGYINISFKGKKGYMLSFTFKEIGITWFLTKEEAEQALKQMGE